MELKRDFKGVWLPAEIYLDDRLSWTEKILFVEINSLDGQQGCFASNAYFAKFLGVSENRISVSISKLKKLEYIEQASFNGRKRVLRTKADFVKTKRQTFRKQKGSFLENKKHNNTDSNKDYKLINEFISKCALADEFTQQFGEKVAREYAVLFRMKQPLTYSQFEELIRTFSPDELNDVWAAMENKPNLTRKYKSANLTTRNWIKVRSKNGTRTDLAGYVNR